MKALPSMLSFAFFLLVPASAGAQQVFTSSQQPCPREAESILIASCRAVGERLSIAMPAPRVELRLGERVDAVDSEGIDHEHDTHVILMRRWNRSLFKRAAVQVCMQAAERELVPVVTVRVRDH